MKTIPTFLKSKCRPLLANGNLCWKSQKCLAAYTKKKQILSQFMPEESSNNFIN